MWMHTETHEMFENHPYCEFSTNILSFVGEILTHLISKMCMYFVYYCIVFEMQYGCKTCTDADFGVGGKVSSERCCLRSIQVPQIAYDLWSYRLQDVTFFVFCCNLFSFGNKIMGYSEYARLKEQWYSSFQALGNILVIGIRPSGVEKLIETSTKTDRKNTKLKNC